MPVSSSPVRRRSRGAAPIALLAAVATPAALVAQAPVPPDSARSDSSGVQALPGVTVSVARDVRPLARVPWAVGVVGTRELRRGQPGVGLDEALTSIPGVYVANRYNFALDQRVTIRGFGTRANFGVRGVQVVLDGIPQTLPDGQSQLSNVDLGMLARAEVLRGPSSSLYGNGAGGVLSFTTDVSAVGAPLTARVEAGADGLLRWQARAAGATGRVSGAIGVSRLTWEGFRPHSSADVRQLTAGADVAVDARTTAQARLLWADTPEAYNPGPLTAAEFATDPDVAVPTNVLRGADKQVQQGQLSLRVHRQAASPAGLALDASAFALVRDLRNAIGTPPPAPSSAANGTFITLDRAAWGARVSAGRALGASDAAPRLTAGVDWRWMRDERANFRATGGRPTAPEDTLLLEQDETVWALGPFAQLEWTPDERWLLSAGGRYDRVRFAAADRFLGDGDQSGERTLPAWSGHLGASYQLHAAFAPYATLATAFETPTTVELQEGAEGGGFAPGLGPQRAVSAELGARGQAADGRLSYSVALFQARITDAIVQYQETGGRAFFRNAGAARHEGLELGVGARASERLGLDVAYTFARYRFTDYRVQRGDDVASFDGNRVPGVPEHFLRVGLRTRPLTGTTLDVDHVVSSAVWADDANTTRVEGWGPGITAARATWQVRLGGTALEPFAGVQNLFDRRYVSSVVVNGFGGRVREPAPGRSWYAGVEVGR
jgi:iron complex outermembrane receptor protein